MDTRSARPPGFDAAYFFRKGGSSGADPKQRSRWRPTRKQLLWAGAGLALLVLLAIAVRIGYRYDITVWDWLKLLVVPVVITGGGIWFNRQQRERELEIADSRAQDEALQAYLDQMSDLLIPTNDRPSLYDKNPPASLRTVARARTLTVLTRLDGDRKKSVVRFLREAGLIARHRPILALPGCDLREANLRGGQLKELDLSEANLREANLSDVQGVTNEEVAQQAAFLELATMPNGQKYGDWLRDKEVRGKDTENSGPS